MSPRRDTGGDRRGGRAGVGARNAQVGRRREAGPAGLGGDQVEGRQAVRELLRAGRRRVHSVVMAAGGDDSAPLAEIAELAATRHVPVRRLSRDQIDALAHTESPQGVVARADPVTETELSDLARRAPNRPAPFLVVLDGVTDPHNLGAIMRSALCAGATGLVIGRHRAARLSPAAVKAAAGAVEHLPVATVAGIPAALGDLSRAGVWTCALSSEADRPLWELEVATEAVALVLGAEGRGLSRLAAQRCDVVLRIPLLGPLESLNVSAAAALGCFEVARRRAVGSSTARPTNQP